MCIVALFDRSHKRVDDRVTTESPTLPISMHVHQVVYYVVNGHRGTEKTSWSVRLSQKCYNASENRGKYGSTNDAFFRAISAITVATPGATCSTAPHSSPRVGRARAQSRSAL